MVKTDFEPYCDNCPYMLVVDDATKICGFDSRAYSAHHVITCEHIDICRRVIDKFRKETNNV